MSATDPYRAAALAALTREFVSTFGEAMPVERFAAPRKEGEEWETNGRWYARQGGKTRRIPNKDALPADPAAKPAAGVGEPPAGGFKVKGGLPGLTVRTAGRFGSADWRKKARALVMETAKADLDKAKRVLNGVDPPPPGTTGADAQRAVRKAQDWVTKLEARNIPAAALPAMRTGQRADTPGGEIGPPREPTPLGNPARARPTAPRRPKVKTFLPPATPPAPPPPTPVETAKLDGYEKEDAVKYGSRASRVIRRVTEALRGLGTLGGLVSGAGLGAKIGGAVAGPLGLALGTAVGGGLGGLAGMWAGNRSGRRAGVLAARATGPANRMAEAFADDLPPDVIQVVKARLAEMAAAAGYRLPPIPDEVVLKAIEMAQQDDAAGAVSEFKCATKTAVRKFSRLARC